MQGHFSIRYLRVLQKYDYSLNPNAVYHRISYVDQNFLASIVIQAAVIFQLATPLIIGCLIAKQFDFNQ